MSSQTIVLNILNHDALVKIKVIHGFYFQYGTNEACLLFFEARNDPVGCDEEQNHTVNGSQHLFFFFEAFGDLNK